MNKEQQKINLAIELFISCYDDSAENISEQAQRDLQTTTPESILRRVKVCTRLAHYLYEEMQNEIVNIEKEKAKEIIRSMEEADKQQKK